MVTARSQLTVSRCIHDTDADKANIDFAGTERHDFNKLATTCNHDLQMIVLSASDSSIYRSYLSNKWHAVSDVCTVLTDSQYMFHVSEGVSIQA